ncbi:MAG: hypothetical protein JJE22_10105, partial [Bacteroidia bacterium]|nr:hypothetical protein [Bacteroidia bacterium]
MRWQMVLSTRKQEVYELWNKEKKLLSLDFHPATNSARIDHADEKRVFLIRREGFLKNKTVLCNEYGIRLGQLLHENKENFIELNHDRFFYAIKDQPKNEVIIYKESIEHPLVVCELNITNANTSIKFDTEKVQPINALSSLLLALSWYILLP